MSARAALSLPPHPDLEPVTVGRIARIEVARDPLAARSAWDALLASASCSPYQTPEWLLPWIATVGAAREPAFVIAYDCDGSAVALLPLCVSRVAGLRVASFLGGRDANTALGLFHPNLHLEKASVESLLQEAASAAELDLFVLLNQPHQWLDRPNPLALLPNQASPSDNHTTSLFRPAERFLSKALSKKSRKRLRWKETKLSALGAVRHEQAGTRPLAVAVVDAYERQRSVRLRATGQRDRVDQAALRRFLLAASGAVGDEKPGVELHALWCGERIAATLMGAVHGGRFSGMLVSFDPDEEIARFGPAELLIAKVIAQKCEEGLHSFDLGIGEARYKEVFCPVPEALFDTVLGVSVIGKLAAIGMRLVLRAKRVAKQTSWIWSGLGWLRRRLYAAAP